MTQVLRKGIANCYLTAVLQRNLLCNEPKKYKQIYWRASLPHPDWLSDCVASGWIVFTLFWQWLVTSEWLKYRSFRCVLLPGSFFLLFPPTFLQCAAPANQDYRLLLLPDPHIEGGGVPTSRRIPLVECSTASDVVMTHPTECQTVAWFTSMDEVNEFRHSKKHVCA